MLNSKNIYVPDLCPEPYAVRSHPMLQHVCVSMRVSVRQCASVCMGRHIHVRLSAHTNKFVLARVCTYGRTCKYAMLCACVCMRA